MPRLGKQVSRKSLRTGRSETDDEIDRRCHVTHLYVMRSNSFLILGCVNP
jgi:hypothetical protein